MSQLSKITASDLDAFISLYKSTGVEFDENEFRSIVKNSILYYSGKLVNRETLRHMQAIENRWYASLEAGKPDYSVYDDTYYLADIWVCWKVYSRRYLKNIIAPNSMPPQSIREYIGEVNRVLDLGCGIGYTTVALSEIFNTEAIGTNLPGTKQYGICQRVFEGTRAKLAPTFYGVDADVVFASEYFEHFERPVEHLVEVLEDIKPAYILFANAFNSVSIGHFNTYYDLDQGYTGKKISKLFYETLRGHGYKKVKTKVFNNRPTLYELK